MEVTDREAAVRRIADVACETMGVTPEAFRGRSRAKRAVLCRWITAALGRELVKASFPEIARAMGRPTHSTVIHAALRLRHELRMDAEIGPLEVLDGKAVTHWYNAVRSALLGQNAQCDECGATPGGYHTIDCPNVDGRFI